MPRTFLENGKHSIVTPAKYTLLWRCFKKTESKVLRIMDEEDHDNLYIECEGEDKNKKIEGLVLIKYFEKDGEEYVDGTIINPNDRKVYRSKIWLDKNDPNILNFRDYIGFFYKTREWERMRK